MTLDEFRATGRDVPDLGKILLDELLDGMPGRIYHQGLFIERKPATGWLNDRPEEYHLLIEREEWMSDDLPRLEAILYEFGLAEGIISA